MSKAPKKTSSNLPALQGEVVVVPGEGGVLHFNLIVPPLLTVEGQFNATFALEAIAAETRLLLKEVTNGKQLQKLPFSKSGIRIHPKLTRNGTGGELSALMDESIREALTREIVLMLSRMSSLAHRVVNEAVVLVGLDMDENEIVDIPKGGRAKVFDEYAEEIGKTARRGVSSRSPVRARTWTKARRRMVLALYDATVERLTELERTYRRLNLDKRPTRAAVQLWAQIRVENPDLAPVLDGLSGRKPLDLARSYVCERLGTKAYHQVYKQIKIARSERSRLMKKDAVVSIEATVGRVVDSIGQKGEFSCDLLGCQK